ncbi:MAG: zf-HC2 domain-containing protein, partial [Candidatus Latescibacterota bacterium]
MTDAHVHEQLSAYLDGEIDAVARERVRVHLDACAACRAELLALEELRGVLRDTPAHEPDASYWERFADRVEARLPQAQAPSRSLVERLSAWLLPAGRLDWPRALGAAATVTLVVFVSVLGLRQERVTPEGSPEVALAPPPPPAPAREPVPGPDREQGKRKETPTKASQSPPRF